MSNISIDALQATKKTIEVYLELDSINSEVLKNFLSKFDIKDRQLKYHNLDQEEILKTAVYTKDIPTLIITYIPYNTTLANKGFKEIISTKDGLDIVVIDALYTKRETFIKHHDQFLALKKYSDQALKNLQNDPKEYYESVKDYIDNLSYEEFRAALNDIIWINNSYSTELKTRLKEIDVPTKDLIP